MTLAMTITLLYNGIVAGYLVNMERNLLDYMIGDIQIFAKGYQGYPSIYNRIEDSEELLNNLDSAGYPASGRLLAAGLGAAEDTSSGVMFIGIDRERDSKVSKMFEQVLSGEWLDPNVKHGVVLGRRLAKTLGLKVGDQLVTLTQAADGGMANELYTVRGILKSVSDISDRTGVFMNSEDYRELMVITKGAHQVVVRTQPGEDLVTAVDKIRSFAKGLDIRSWKQLMPTIATMLESTQGMMAIMSFIIYIAIGILILNAMLMAVFERVREFGVMKALGVSPFGVMSLILAETAIQTVLAIVSAMIISAPLLWQLTVNGFRFSSLESVSLMGLAWDPHMYAIVTPASYITPIIMLVFVVSMAVIYPALKAALITPVKAIHHQ
jgi:ABC-type lipoprotein release transport system permease subunit